MRVGHFFFRWNFPALFFSAVYYISWISGWIIRQKVDLQVASVALV